MNSSKSEFDESQMKGNTMTRFFDGALSGFISGATL
jgi:hypothetical protein